MTRLAFLLSLAAASLLVFPSPAPAAEYSSERWEKDIQAFEAADKKQMPPEGIVLFTGASGIKRWGTLAQNFPQHKVLNRGFGGCRGVVVIAGLSDADERISADDKRRAGKDRRLLFERRRSREPQGCIRRLELSGAELHLGVV